MNSDRRIFLFGGIGCLAILLLAVIGLAYLFAPFSFMRTTDRVEREDAAVEATVIAERDEPADIVTVPTFTPAPVASTAGDAPAQSADSTSGQVVTPLELNSRYERLNPGVVNIQVLASGGLGGGAGSGFILDTEGHIVTNNHVVEQADQIVVNFFNGLQANAEIIGLDDDSDLAIIQVDELPDGVHPLPLADSDTVRVGDWAIAIGNPFGLGSSMSLGIVSAIGRTIPSGATQFSIPQAIQTDAAINPGNSGGPLLNLNGEVIGVNAQIRTTGAGVNSGVGFAIPSNVVRRIAPSLIEQGRYQWPWLGVSGSSLNLVLAQANNVDMQQGAYIAEVVEGGPADRAGLRGSSNVRIVNGIQVPTGGDVVIAIDGEPVANFDELLTQIAFKEPNETVELTILRNGRERTIEVQLEPRPGSARI